MLRKDEANKDKTDAELRPIAEQKAAAYSARPGHSEHNLGTAFDIMSKENTDFDFARDNWNKGLYQWFRDNAHKFGFAISYPRGNDNRSAKAMSGYSSNEPWHLRFVGKPLASYLNEKQYREPNTPTTLQTVLMQLQMFIKN